MYGVTYMITGDMELCSTYVTLFVSTIVMDCVIAMVTYIMLILHELGRLWMTVDLWVGYLFILNGKQVNYWWPRNLQEIMYALELQTVYAHASVLFLVHI